MANADKRNEQADAICVEKSGHEDEIAVSASPDKVKDADLPATTMTKISSSTITTSTPRSNSITNAVTPGTTASSVRGMNNNMNNNSTCNDKMPSSTSDSFIILDTRSSSSENAVATSMTIPPESCGSTKEVMGSSSSAQPTHFTFEESKLPTSAQHMSQHRDHLKNENISINMVNNSHVPIVAAMVPTSNHSCSPTITTSRRGGRSSPLTTSICSSPPPP